jgi:Guanosine polyphosphate pyrophosphohydrolases/synthetases
MTSDSKVAEALQLAKTVHHGQYDKSGLEYVEHVKAVAKMVRHLGEQYEIVGLLHDSVEDCKDRSIISFEIIAARFGEEIGEAVRAMTHEPGENYHENYLPRVMKNPISSEVKRADVAHNHGRLHLLDAQTEVRLRVKYEAFFDRYGRPECNITS